MKINSSILRYSLLLFLAITVACFSNSALAQNNKPYVRIANIIIDSAQLQQYSDALKEHAKAAISKEKGVLTLYAVYDKEKPTHVTVFEIYASVRAYQSHIRTKHFLKYKTTVKDMVKSLVLTDVIPITFQRKEKWQP